MAVDHERELRMIQGIAKLLAATKLPGAATFFRTKSSSKTDALIRQVVDASLAGVCCRVSKQIDTMSLSEARGYVRARATGVVRRETRLTIDRLSRADGASSATVARMATERLVPIVLRELSVGIPRLPAIPMAA